MFTFSRLGLAAVAAVTIASSASALSITPATVAFASGDETSQAAINAIIGPLMAPSIEVYKDNVGTDGNPNPADVGTLSGSYETVFSNSALDPSAATISYVGGQIVSPTAYLLVKGGGPAQVAPFWYLFDLTSLSWNGTETLELTNFWPAQGAISHVTLYGGTSQRVNESGSSIALLGLGLTLLALGRRKFV